MFREARGPAEPRVEDTSRYTERLAHRCQRRRPSVFRHEQAQTCGGAIAPTPSKCYKREMRLFRSFLRGLRARQPMLSDGKPRVSVDEACRPESQGTELSRIRVFVAGQLPELGVWYLEDCLGSRYFVDSSTALHGIELSSNLVIGALVNGEGHALTVFPVDRL